MVLGGGLTVCGHCGSRMYGESHKTRAGRVYSYYVCSGNKAKPGTCEFYKVREDRLLPALVRKLVDVYLDPARLEGLKAALRRRWRPSRKPTPPAPSLRRELDDLDRDIKQGTRNLVRATDNLDLIQEALTGLRAERERTTADLETAERDKGVPQEEMERRVDAAVERLAGLRDQLRKVDRDRLRAVLSLSGFPRRTLTLTPRDRPRREIVTGLFSPRAW